MATLSPWTTVLNAVGLPRCDGPNYSTRVEHIAKRLEANALIAQPNFRDFVSVKPSRALTFLKARCSSRLCPHAKGAGPEDFARLQSFADYILKILRRVSARTQA